MCRLIGLRASGAVPLYRYLIGGDNSFAVQSLEHPDGWGLAYYQNGEPTVIKSVLPAICDEAFEEASFSVTAPTVLAHIRRATAGRVARQNCHPFRRGSWVFAHNGHIQGIEHIRDALIARISPELREPLEGQTDSELYFLLFLSALAERAPLEDPAPTLETLLGAMVAAVRTITELSESPGGPATALTCLASNGEVMFGMSRGRPLSVRAQTDRNGALVMFSSEAVGTKGFLADGPSWLEMADNEIVMVDRDLGLRRGSLQL